MKSEFLKIAKCKTDKEFYKKYPSEAAFFKAHPEAKKLIKKAQVGIQTGKQTDVNGNGIPDYQENTSPQNIIPNFGISAQTMGRVQGTPAPVNQPATQQSYGPGGVNYSAPIVSRSSSVDTSNPNWMNRNTSGMPEETSQVNKNYTGYQGIVSNTPSKSLEDKAAPYIGGAKNIFSGIGSLKAQGDEKDRMRQMRKLTDVMKIASGTRDVDASNVISGNLEKQRDAMFQLIQPNQLSPTYGSGSNILTRNGGSIQRAEQGRQIFGNPTEIQNTYAPEYDIYDDGGYEPLNDSNRVKQYYYGGGIPTAQDGGGFMDFMQSQGGGQALGMLTNAFSSNSGESQIGQGIGTIAGAATGIPGAHILGGALGGLAGGMFNTSQKSIKNDRRAIQKNVDTMIGNQFGQAFHQGSVVTRNGGNFPNYEEGGQLTNPQLITRFGELDEQDFYDYAHEGMDTLRAGGNLRSYTPPTNRAMQTYAMGGELETHWGGEAETMSYNPYLPGQGETVMFRGQSHDESDGKGNTGIGITYGNSPVEVERGEPAVKLKDGSSGEENLTVYGNLKIPNEYISLLGDEKAKGKKFKNYIAEISKDEAKQNKLVEKSTNLLNSLDVKNSFDKLKFDALTANINGANMKLKSIADKKMNAASLQNAINDTAEEYGLVADDLARGKAKIDKEAMKEYAEYGKSIKKAQDGIYKTKGTGDKWSFTQAGQTGNPLFDDMQRYENEWTPEVNKALSDKERADKMLTYIENYSGEGSTNIKKALNKIPTKEGKITFLQQQATNKEVGPIHHVVDAAIKFTSPQMTTPLKEEVKETKKEADKTYQTAPYKRSVLMDVANQILPFIRPTDQEPLDPRQLYGEMYALSNNQLEPVQAQSYQPNLLNTYDISLQDQLDEITASERAAQRMAMGNPSALANIAAQSQAAKNKVLSEQFRLNQGMDMGVYNANTQTLNDAKLKNLDIFDRQYGRQAQAKSNTKAIEQAALSSIGDKYAKNRLENRELGIMENMYNYRFDPAGRAINMNPLYQPNMPTVNSEQKNPNMIPVKDSDGNIIEFRSIDTSTATPGIVADGQTQAAKFGKAVSKYAKNGSIVKAYKNL